MPFVKRHRILRRRQRRTGAARSIQSAWRRKKRAKTSLLSRTALANRKAIKSIQRSTETNMIQNVAATGANSYGGQFFRSAVGDLGQDAAANALVWKPMRGMGEGAASNQRDGEVVTMQSLSYRIEFLATNAVTPIPNDAYNRCGVYVVLDTKGGTQGGALAAPNLCTGNWSAAAPNGGTLMSVPIQAYGGTDAFHAWLNRNTCSGPNCRYKILRKHEVVVQPTGQDGAVYPASRIISGTLKGKYRIRYPKQTSPPSGAELVPSNQEILFFFFSDSTAAPFPTCNGVARFRYKDA